MYSVAMWHVIYGCSSYKKPRERWNLAGGSPLGMGNWQEKYPDDLRKWDTLCCTNFVTILPLLQMVILRL